MFRFLHAADLHLDSPLRGLSRYEGAPLEALRGATRRAFENLVREAIRLEVDLLLLAGDLYDGDWPDYNTGLFFVQQMQRLEQASIPVVAISGNHDAASRLTRRLTLPSNVTLLAAEQPQSVKLGNRSVWVHGQSFPQPEVLDDLSRDYPAPRPHAFNIGLLHTSLDGRPGHAGYAPCSLDSLRSKGYDYWALGHVHQREVLAREPWIVFSGNLQGRHARETGPKGATLVTVGEGEVSRVEPLVLDVVRWERVGLDLSECRSGTELLALFKERLHEARDRAGERLLAVRVVIAGEGPVRQALWAQQDRWLQELRACALALPEVWLERLVIERRQSDLVPVQGEEHNALSYVLRGVARLQEEPEDLQALGRELFSKLESQLPSEWTRGPQGWDPTSPEALAEALARAGELLRAQLEGEEVER